MHSRAVASKSWQIILFATLKNSGGSGCFFCWIFLLCSSNRTYRILGFDTSGIHFKYIYITKNKTFIADISAAIFAVLHRTSAKVSKYLAILLQRMADVSMKTHWGSRYHSFIVSRVISCITELLTSMYSLKFSKKKHVST